MGPAAPADRPGPGRRRRCRHQPRGTPIRPRPFTASYKEKLLCSRLDATTTLSQALAVAAAADPGRPRILLSASAVGYYGDTGARTVTEQDPAGTDFLAQLCAQWEAATGPAEAAGVRVVHLRTGLVLDRRAMLVQILGRVFRLGLGGRMGTGRQYWPWISLTDQVGAIRHLLAVDVSGPVNLTGPAPATNAEFTRELARQVHRPAVLPVPAFAINLALGEFGRSSVTAGQRAMPVRLEESGYRFTHADLESALRAATAR
ncbi:TIGR01777 family oxidoreductase [Blastococcus brunescens]|uniref:TIGR01777 family oxidoreductase n=1 Tax=Blastococcus brunescens TaxID=1564165 RepID=A0ABZ1B7Z1_9ACTN|nr:TIGR01777 family oxidoreductase [Blastococcus sp. BMG 8361]WRL66927.1 TIGR01777 family oxidoreductase [Blastococcus sp. BMG 8361]